MAKDEPLVLIGTLPPARLLGLEEQVMVTVWPDGTGEVAFRQNEQDQWGPPTALRKAP